MTLLHITYRKISYVLLKEIISSRWCSCKTRIVKHLSLTTVFKGEIEGVIGSIITFLQEEEIHMRDNMREIH